MKKVHTVFDLAVTLNLLAVSTAFAQTDTIHLSLSRDWGYGGFRNDIQGIFSMKVTGPDSLVLVDFYIDEIMIGEISTGPFRLQFNTDDYELGQHTLYVIGHTSDGQELRSNEIVAEFVPSQSVGKFIIPILVIMVLAVVGSSLVPILLTRGKLISLVPGSERKYGIGGGGICSKCHRPFALPLLSVNLGFSKFARCPYCGKWGVVRVQTLAKLREAEKAELEWGKTELVEISEEERLRKELDDSKYQGA